MSKYNKRSESTRVVQPIVSTPEPFERTHGGGPGFSRDTKGELFLLAVSNLVGEKTFYEDPGNRDGRYVNLIHRVALSDPKWLFEMLRWLRADANMRSASMVGAAEMVRARLLAGAPPEKVLEGSARDINREVIDVVCQRADEPGELLAYWIAVHGKPIPKPIKRGLGDAARRLYNEFSLLKWDSGEHGVRFADVLELARVKPSGGLPWQGPLFKHAIDLRHNREIDYAELSKRGLLPSLVANKTFRDHVNDGRTDLLADASAINAAGMTWEKVLSLAGSKIDKKELWEALIPNMGYMALLRNLRNFDEAGISSRKAEAVARKLADPAEVAKSNQLPMRFLSAYRAAPSLRWGYALETALDLCLGNIPAMPGRTLILIDTSASMDEPLSEKSELQRWDAAVVFGLALARRCEIADVISYSDNYWNEGQRTKVFKPVLGGSLLKDTIRWSTDGYNIFGGTDTAGAVRKHYNGHDRVIILTDEQATTNLSVSEAVPQNRTLITFNLAGYKHGHGSSGTARRITVGGISDSGFQMLALTEGRNRGEWPWERQ